MCVLEAQGERFDPREFVKIGKLRSYKVFRKGDRRFPKSPGVQSQRRWKGEAHHRMMRTEKCVQTAMR